jgi:nucleotide-binding universal stress UspA family protein
MIALKTILVATDFGAAADNALRYARELARAHGAALHVLDVTENVFAGAMDGYGYSAIPSHVQQQLEQSGRRQTEALVSDEDRRELRARAITVTSHDPAAAIVDYARANAIDLIVLGTHGRGAVAHALMGNVAERVVRTAPCPVFTVRQLEREFVFPDALVALDRPSPDPDRDSDC